MCLPCAGTLLYADSTNFNEYRPLSLGKKGQLVKFLWLLCRTLQKEKSEIASKNEANAAEKMLEIKK